MKVKVPIALIVILAIACGYLLGTESGRQKRDVILVKLGRADEGVTEAVTDATEQVAAAIPEV